jgi:coenzyme F420-reducing hydrogenase beta subunit
VLWASLINPRSGAQWTGITTRIGERLLETGAVDAVLTMEPPHIWTLVASNDLTLNYDELPRAGEEKSPVVADL